MILKGDALDLLEQDAGPFDLIATDPPYAFGNTVDEHQVTATVAIVLREAAKKIRSGRYMLVMCASSWRSISYMVESVRGVLDPVRVGTWVKPCSNTRVQTVGWTWASVSVLVFRRGRPSDGIEATDMLDNIAAPVVKKGRRAQLPPQVADWMVSPFAVRGGRFLDPFAGSGALVEAATRAGMQARGYERNPAEAGP